MIEEKWCGCIVLHSYKDGIDDLISREFVDGKRRGEIYELFGVRTMAAFKDEMSDIIWGVGRLIGKMLGKDFVRLPGDQMHYDKIVGRMEEYACIRSKRFLIEGKCPNS